jgi:hypothetical protein
MNLYCPAHIWMQMKQKISALSKYMIQIMLYCCTIHSFMMIIKKYSNTENTNFMKQGLPWKLATQLGMKFLAFKEPKMSLPHSQVDHTTLCWASSIQFLLHTLFL